MDRVSIERMCASREFQLPSRRCRRRKGPRGKVASNATVHGDGIPNGMGTRLELGNGKERECRNRLAVISSTVPGVPGHAAGEHNKQRYECEVRETDDDSAAKFATVAHDRGKLLIPKWQKILAKTKGRKETSRPAHGGSAHRGKWGQLNPWKWMKN